MRIGIAIAVVIGTVVVVNLVDLIGGIVSRLQGSIVGF